MATKKVKSAGRFGARYGKKTRQRIIDIEVKQKQKQKCPFCKKLGAKRLAVGIWLCRKCDTKFASNAYSLR